jgi:hypothetical protein
MKLQGIQQRHQTTAFHMKNLVLRPSRQPTNQAKPALRLIDHHIKRLVVKTDQSAKPAIAKPLGLVPQCLL